jgi:hypothetical protein
MRKTNKERVLDYIRDFGSITSLEAFRDLGNTRLSASIWLLRHEDGLDIRSINESSKNRYGDKVNYSRYYLANSEYETKLLEGKYE